MTRSGLQRIGIVTGLVVMCEAACRFGWVSRHTLVPPTEMAATLAALMRTEDFWSQASFTAGNILVSFVSAVIVGFAIGVVLHRLPRTRRAIEPMIASYYALPFFVLYPLFIVLLGMNALPIIFMGFLYAVMAMITGTLTGLDRVPRIFLKLAQTYRMDRLRQALLIQLPGAAPYVFTGVKLAFGYAITGVIGSEFILSNNGLGYGIAFSYNNFDDRTMYALLVFVLVSVSILTLVLHAAEQRVQYRARAGAVARAADEVGTAGRWLGLAACILVILVVWEIVFLRVGQEAVASPLTSFRRLGILLTQDDFWANVAETMRALALSLGLSCVVGALVGMALGVSKAASDVLAPLLIAFYAMPKVTLYPVILLFFGIGLAAKVAFGAIYGMIPMILITMNAILSMNPSLRRTSQVMHLTRVQYLCTVVLPATLPEMVSGLRISFSITLLGVMIGEMFASQRGLGFMIMNSMGVNDTSTMMAVTVLISIFALTMNGGLMLLDTRFRRS
ncbi:MAG TPA: ABC transporter permease subunit [Aliidongia sp.]|uniref:ABC transporter permease n=1 Tax=Aliidongia sp. TaxID=1914230 RepID=UPI002DDD27DC|nr:ABC transporter permease subunit [Aliidongia sp.]HEV2677374.1 ABC transporter permease subunit [Aliidongia sp.]